MVRGLEAGKGTQSNFVHSCVCVCVCVYARARVDVHEGVDRAGANMLVNKLHHASISFLPVRSAYPRAYK